MKKRFCTIYYPRAPGVLYIHICAYMYMCTGSLWNELKEREKNGEGIDGKVKVGYI